MNLTIKKEWYDAAESIKDALQRAEFYEIMTRYFFEGKEPEENASPAYLIFRLIRSELDRDKQEKIKREVRRTKKKQQPKTDQPPTIPQPTTDQKATKTKPSEEKKRFVKPTVEEIAEYIKEKGYSVNAQTFFNYYESNGWHVGRNPMKNWKAAVTNWANNTYGKKDNAAGTVWQKEHDAAADYMDLI